MTGQDYASETQIPSAADLTVRISSVKTGKRRVGLCAGFKSYGAMMGVVKFENMILVSVLSSQNG